MINGELIDLVAGDYEARIASSGAMLVHLRRQGRDLIMPFDAEATLPAGWQGKTLLPWANRIAGALQRACQRLRPPRPGWLDGLAGRRRRPLRA